MKSSEQIGPNPIITCQFNLQSITRPPEMSRSEIYTFLKAANKEIIDRLLLVINAELRKSDLATIDINSISITVFSFVQIKMPLEAYRVVTRLMATGQLPNEVLGVLIMPNIPINFYDSKNHR